MENFRKNANYKDESIRTIDPKITGTTLEICDQIFSVLTTYYNGRDDYECRSIAKLFFWALQEYAEPSFVPRFIERNTMNIERHVTEINNNEVIILKFAVPIAVYHYIVACKLDKSNYKIYSAFGHRFIQPFIVPAEEFIECCTRLVLAEYDMEYNDNLGEIRFFRDCDRIIGFSFQDYIRSKYFVENLNNMIFSINENINEKTGIQHDRLTILNSVNNINILHQQLSLLIRETRLLKKTRNITTVRKMLLFTTYYLQGNIEMAVKKFGQIENYHLEDYFNEIFQNYKISSDSMDSPIRILKRQ